jgi:GPH family glycoside/pentoside/hexuronide:cation symporter
VAIIFGIVAAIGFLITFFNTKEHVREEKLVEEKEHTTWERLASMMKNTPWIVITLLMLVSSISQTVLSSIQVYYVKYYLGLPETFAGTVLLVSMAGMFIGIFIGPFILAKTDFRKAMIVATIIGIIGRIILLLIGKSQMGLLIISAVTTLASGIPSVAIYAMFGDTVEYGEWKTGVRSEGLTFCSFTFAQKVAAGVGGFIVGMILGNLGYDAELAVQSTRVVNGIIFTFIAIPIILAVLTIVAILFYKLDRKTYNQIILELKERRIASSGRDT